MSFPRDRTEDPQTEHLLRKALDLPDTQKNVIGIIRNLNVGVMTSRRLVSILQTFRGGGFETQSVDLQTIVTEGFGTRVPEQPRVAYAEERTIRDDEEQREPVPRRRTHLADRAEPEEEELVEEEPAPRLPRSRRVVSPARQKVGEGEAGGLNRDKESLEGRRCLFHGGVAVARCKSCKAILCKECLRGADRCPRCNAPFSDEGEDEEREEPRRPEPRGDSQKRAPKVEHDKERDFSRL